MVQIPEGVRFPNRNRIMTAPLMTIYSNSFNYSASIKVAQMFNRGGPVFLSCVLLRFVGYMKKTMHAIDGGSLMKILRYIKRRIILAGLMVMLTMSPLYATMPVVDFTSIINEIGRASCRERV